MKDKSKGKPKDDSKFVGFRVPVELYDKLSAQAKRDSRSLANFVTLRLGEIVEKEEISA